MRNYLLRLWRKYIADEDPAERFERELLERTRDILRDNELRKIMKDAVSR